TAMRVSRAPSALMVTHAPMPPFRLVVAGGYLTSYADARVKQRKANQNYEKPRTARHEPIGGRRLYQRSSGHVQKNGSAWRCAGANKASRRQLQFHRQGRT